MLDLVAVKNARALARVQRLPVADPQEPERHANVKREPIRAAKVARFESVVERLTLFVGELHVLRGEHVADVVEEADPHSVTPARRPRGHRLELKGGEQIAAIWTAERITRPRPPPRKPRTVFGPPAKKFWYGGSEGVAP